MRNVNAAPRPWTLGDNIPWHDQGFSERMLQEHLSQQHDHASRRFEIIDKQVQWINATLLPHPPSRILDLGCGPGFYLHRLALLGHHGVGIDYSPASIAYAKEAARRAGLQIRYRLEDLRTVEWGAGFDLIMLIWGEFNVFAPQEAKRCLRKAAAALADHGQLLLEVHTAEAIKKRGQGPTTQSSSHSGLFSDQPHQCLQEHFWHAAERAATTRYTVTEPATGQATVYAASYQAYSDPEYVDLLGAAGLSHVTRHASLTGEPDQWFENLIVWVAQK